MPSTLSLALLLVEVFDVRMFQQVRFYACVVEAGSMAYILEVVKRRNALCNVPDWILE